MVTLRRADIEDARLLYIMQLKCFRSMLAYYQDWATNPANEPMSRTQERIIQPETEYYIVDCDGEICGGVRVRVNGASARLGPLYTLPEMRGKGIMQDALRQIEAMHPECTVWELDTIKQEKGNCHLYEKLGYRLTGAQTEVNARMTLVDYRKEK